MAECSRILVIAVLAVGCGGEETFPGSGSPDPGSQGAGSGGPGPSSGSGVGTTCNAIGPALDLGPGTTPAVTWTGSHFAIAYQGTSVDAGDIHVALVDESGDLRASATLVSTKETSAVPTIARHGDDLLVAWRDSDGWIRAHAVDGKGSPKGSIVDVAQTADPDSRPRAIGTGAGVVLAWSDEDASVVGRFESGGLGAASTLKEVRFPTLAPAGNTVGVAFAEQQSVGLVKMSPSDLQAGAKVTSEATAQNLAIASDGERFVVAWEDLRSGTEEILAAWMDSGGAEQASIPSGGGSANWPSIAWTGSHAAIAYYQFRDGPPSIFLALVGKDLKRVADVEVTPGVSARFPAVAWSGSRLAVAYALEDGDGDVQVAMMQCN